MIVEDYKVDQIEAPICMYPKSFLSQFGFWELSIWSSFLKWTFSIEFLTF